MNLQQLYYFRTVARLEHFTRATEELSISQSSLSHAIKGLEEELNAELFTRSGRNVVLTRFGKMLLPFVEDALTSLETGISKVRDAIDPDSGTVSIACFPSLATFVPDLIVRYISESKRLNVHLQTSHETYFSIRDDLLAGKVDLAFSTAFDDPSITGVPVGNHELVLLVSKSHRLARYDDIDLKELNGEEFIAYNDDCQIRLQTDDMFRKLGVSPKVTMESAQDIFIYSLVAANRGVAIVPHPLGSAPYNTKVLHIRNAVHTRTLYMVWRKDAYMSPAVEYFRDFVIKGGMVFDEYCRRNRLL